MKMDQERDPEISVILLMKKMAGSQPSWNEVGALGSCSKELWAQWDRLEVIDGVLYRQFMPLDGRPRKKQLIVPKVRRDEFMRMSHEGQTGGHMGRRRTADQVQRRGYWPGWTLDVRLFVKNCSDCAQYHRGKPPKQTMLSPMTAGEPWETLSIDITGPHPRSVTGKIYILTAIDHFSKWAEAIALPNHTATTVARALLVNVFSKFGMPMRVLSDQGTEFESDLFQELCRCLEISKIRTSPYRPSTNGAVERFHRTLNTMLAKVVRDDHRDWCLQLQPVLAAYRNSVHESTGYTPNFLFLGREVRTPMDVVIGLPPGEPVSNDVNADEEDARRLRLGKTAFG